MILVEIVKKTQDFIFFLKIHDSFIIVVPARMRFYSFLPST